MKTESTTLLSNQSSTPLYTNSTTRSQSSQTNKSPCLLSIKGAIITTLTAALLLCLYILHSPSSGTNSHNNLISTSTSDNTISTSSDSNDNINNNPNIIFILLDDLGYGEISLRGSEYSTPNIDKLYSNSIVINSHYIGLVCSPSRSQILTGRYAWNMGISAQHAFSATTIQSFPSALPTLANLLNQYTNYISYFTGKWQLGYSTNEHLPLSRGFKEFYGFYTSNIDYNTKKMEKQGWYDTSYIDWRTNNEVDYDTLDTFSTFVTGDTMTDIINRHVENNPNSPFYLHAAFQAVHADLVNIDSDNSDLCDVIDIDDSDAATSERYMMCQNVLAVDQVIGDLMDNLQTENDIWDNTLIIFTSDNGAGYSKGGCNYPLRGAKDTFFEGGIKTLAFLAGGYVTSLKSNEKYANSQQRFYNKDSYIQGQNIMLHSTTTITNDELIDIDIRDGFMHASDWVPTILSIAGANINQIEYDLQQNLYIPMAKEISFEQEGNQDNYINYLMDNSFDGEDISEWLLYGNTKQNNKNTVPLSVNLRSLEGTSIKADVNGTLDNAIVFQSSLTGNIYKLMYLESEISDKTRNTEICLFNEKSDNIDEYIRSSDKPEMSSTNKLLFDITLESTENTNLIEYVSQMSKSKSSNTGDTDNEMDDLMDYLQQIADEHLGDDNLKAAAISRIENVIDVDDNDMSGIGGSDGYMYIDSDVSEVKDISDYDAMLIRLLWTEGIKLIASYADNVMFNTNLRCLEDSLYEDADPSLLENGDAFAPFYDWGEYTTQFNDMCNRNEINVVLNKMYQTKYTDYI